MMSGTTDAVARARVNEVLEKYRARVAELTKEGRAKSDMIAFKELKEELIPSDTHGHLPGIRVGDVFNNRGELAILGLHKEICRGINSKLTGPGSDKGAYAIVLAGGYADDEDEGTSFWYTGEGGLAKKGKGTQISDQTLKGGNLALKRSYESRTPVRVFRGSREGGKLQYTYEGLYRVAEMKHVASTAGPFVYKFRMEGITGESTATSKVAYRSLHHPTDETWLARSKLATTVESPPDAAHGKRRKGQGWDSATERQARLIGLQGRPGLLMEDISHGTEAGMPIPLFNEVDSRSLSAEEYEYIAECVFAPGVEAQVAEILDQESRKMRLYTGQDDANMCGIAFCKKMRSADQKWFQAVQANAHAFEWANGIVEQPVDAYLTSEDNYTEDGCLLTTDPCGIHECGPQCVSPRCTRNQVVTRGINLPLEVFMTKSKGWGVRCAEAIPAGAFVACYVGELVTEAQAQQLASQDHYLFSLDFFMQLFKEVHARGYDGVEAELPAHKMPPFPQLPFPSALMSSDTNEQQGQPKQRNPSSDANPLQCAANAGAAASPASDARPLLSVDGMRKGNVARFINHSCDGNLAIQGVFAKDARSVVLYNIAMFAAREIPAMTELTYNYSYHKQGIGSQQGMRCLCGAPNCEGSFL